MVNGEANSGRVAATDANVPASEVKQEVTSAEAFLTKSALYVLTRVEGFSPPQEISFECPGKCGKETTWYRAYSQTPLGSRDADGARIPDYLTKSVAYTCFLCKKETLTVIYREMEFEERIVKLFSTGGRIPPPKPNKQNVLVGVVKIGQYPEPAVEIPRSVSKKLGKEATGLYRKALICRNQGFGLAAVGYMRRVVEDKTNELIEIAAKLAESHGVDPTAVSKMRQAADSTKYTTYEKKLEFAATVFPESLKVGGANPLTCFIHERADTVLSA
jgi:translation elongation factor EF-1beta